MARAQITITIIGIAASWLRRSIVSSRWCLRSWPKPFGTVVCEAMNRGKAVIGRTPGGVAIPRLERLYKDLVEPAP